MFLRRRENMLLNTGNFVKFLFSNISKDEEALRNFEFTPDKFTNWEDDQATVAQVKTFGEMLSKL